MTEVAQRLAHEIDRDASGSITLSEEVTNTATRDRYIMNSLIEEAITSSQLEGAATTYEVAKEMLRSSRPPRDDDERMIANNFEAMQYIREHLDEPLSVEAVLTLHGIVAQGTLDEPDAERRVRRPGEVVRVVDPEGRVLHDPPPAEQLGGRLEAMCDFANAHTPEGFVHPVVRAILLHFWLAFDHPFVDGNGRAARALFYWSMLRQGYWLAEYVSISRIVKGAPAQYGRAFLHTETDDNDATYFVLHHLNVLRRAIDELHVYLRRKMAEVRRVEDWLAASEALNHRQFALLSHAVRHPNARYTIRSHQRSHAVSYQTARTDLLELAELEFLQRRRTGRKFVFVPMPNLEERLAKHAGR
ncbi:MAG: Fic family protein [Myxococcota bacterium]